MGLIDKLRGELIEIIEWLDDSGDTMVYRFPRYQNEIKNGAQLVVRELQTAVFVNEGQVADVFTPGTYSLETKNLPILSTLTEEVEEYLRQMIVGRLAGALAAAQVAVLDLAAHQEQIAASLAGTLTEECRPIGVAIPKFIIENVSLPPEVEQAMDKRAGPGRQWPAVRLHRTFRGQQGDQRGRVALAAVARPITAIPVTATTAARNAAALPARRVLDPPT